MLPLRSFSEGALKKSVYARPIIADLDIYILRIRVSQRGILRIVATLKASISEPFRSEIKKILLVEF